jgi:hypothetical protein
VWPLAVRAQQTDGMRRIGVLSIEDESDARNHKPLGPFLRALDDLGWNDAHNIRIEARYFGGDASRADKLAKEPIELNLGPEPK